MLASISRNWWILLLRGVGAVIFGMLAVGWPGITLTTLVLVFGAYAILNGVYATALGIGGSSYGARWWEMILLGLVSVAAGVVTFAWPGITAVALLMCIAAWAIVGGIMEIVAAIRLRAIVQNEWLLILSGICSILFGVVMCAWPGAGALAVLWIIGMYSVVVGVLMMALSFKLRSLKPLADNRSGVAAASV